MLTDHNFIDTSAVIIRTAAKDDLQKLEWDGELIHYRRLFADTYRLVETGQAKIWIAEKQDEYLIGQLFVSLNGGRPELADGHTRAYIYGFRIKPAFRSHGIGTRLMACVEQDLCQQEFQIVNLNVAKNNHGARRFYDRLGYVVIGSDPGHWKYIDHRGIQREVHEPAWRMSKHIVLHII
jgi:ribosomal protein S18 acetylase RimI-like enzyme